MKNLKFFEFNSDKKSENVDILTNLKDKQQKKINSKYFYNEMGSKLFDQISKLDDYYPTRKELEILDKKKIILNQLIPENASIIEFGSGSNIKINKLLKMVRNPKRYISIDISREFLLSNAEKIAKNFPLINVNAVCSDFMHTNLLKKIINKSEKNVGFFPGSTIGNFCPDDAKSLMKNFARILGKNNFIIIGVDLRKNKDVMEKAYNDPQGVTAKFNKNILNEVYRKTGLKINKKNFDHKAYFNNEKKRIEMHLVSKISHKIDFCDEQIKIKEGETIHTENSYKYTIDEFKDLAKKSGFKTIKVLTDSKNYFSIFYLRVFSN
tara:strand:+ start:714 stop:1682 length:969 start_codon:yes stop_codon:yes gene_type:complete